MTRLIWQGKRMLNTYRGEPCGDDVWEYGAEGRGGAEFEVRVLLDSEGGLRSEYLVAEVQPDALQGTVKQWATLYKNNHVTVLESAMLDLLRTMPEGDSSQP